MSNSEEFFANKQIKKNSEAIIRLDFYYIMALAYDSFSFFKVLFIYFEREPVRVQAGEKQRERESEPDVELEPMNRKITT